MTAAAPPNAIAPTRFATLIAFGVLRKDRAECASAIQNKSTAARLTIVTDAMIAQRLRLDCVRSIREGNRAR